MAQIPRESAVRILQTILADAEDFANKYPASSEWYKGRAAGVQSAIDILTKDENEFLPKSMTINTSK